MDFLQDLIDAIKSLFGLDDQTQRTETPSEPGREVSTPVGRTETDPGQRSVSGQRTATSSEPGESAQVSKPANLVQVNVEPLRYRIRYEKDEWSVNEELLTMFDDKEILSFSAGHGFLRGFEYPYVNYETPRVRNWDTVVFETWWSSQLVGLPYPESFIPGISGEGERTKTLASSGQTFYAVKDADKELILDDFIDSGTWRIQTLTGFWLFEKDSGPRGMTNDEAIDQATYEPCRDSETKVTCSVYIDRDSLRAKAGSKPGWTIEPIANIWLHRYIIETNTSKYVWYPFCKLYQGIGGLLPDWVMDLIAGLQKGIAGDE